MIAVVVLAIVIYFASSLINRDTDNIIISEINSLVRQSYKYSGLNKDIHNEFVENIKLALEHRTNTELSRKYLNRALENLNEISLSSMSGDTDELEDIDTIISDLRTYFEYLYNVIEQRESE
jgi:hypothetical protein